MANLKIDDNGTIISFDECKSEEDFKNKGLTIIPTNNPNGTTFNVYEYSNVGNFINKEYKFVVKSSKAWNDKYNLTATFTYAYTGISGNTVTLDVTFQF